MILLISPKCPLCQKVLEIIKNQSISGLKIYDIHKISKVPNGITHVPSLITDDKKILKGGQVLKKVEELTFVSYDTSSTSGFADASGETENIYDMATKSKELENSPIGSMDSIIAQRQQEIKNINT